jgi:hypothetical protein
VRVLACASFLSLLALTGCLTDSKPDPAQFEAADNEKCIAGLVRGSVLTQMIA